MLGGALSYRLYKFPFKSRLRVAVCSPFICFLEPKFFSLLTTSHKFYYLLNKFFCSQSNIVSVNTRGPRNDFVVDDFIEFGNIFLTVFTKHRKNVTYGRKVLLLCVSSFSLSLIICPLIVI